MCVSAIPSPVLSKPSGPASAMPEAAKAAKAKKAKAEQLDVDKVKDMRLLLEMNLKSKNY